MTDLGTRALELLAEHARMPRFNAAIEAWESWYKRRDALLAEAAPDPVKELTDYFAPGRLHQWPPDDDLKKMGAHWSTIRERLSRSTDIEGAWRDCAAEINQWMRLNHPDQWCKFADGIAAIGRQRRGAKP